MVRKSLEISVFDNEESVHVTVHSSKKNCVSTKCSFLGFAHLCPIVVVIVLRFKLPTRTLFYFTPTVAWKSRNHSVGKKDNVHEFHNLKTHGQIILVLLNGLAAYIIYGTSLSMYFDCCIVESTYKEDEAAF